MMDVFNYECDGQMSIFDEKPLDNKNNVTDNLTNERTNERTIRKVHLFFEQSGTFKNQFKELGYEAYDYDILDDYGQTDFQVDLFAEIEKGYNGENSIFDDISHDDLIMAFFPCVRFENQIMLHFRGDYYGSKNHTMKQKMEYCMKIMSELKHNYDLVNKMFIICIDRGLRLIMENPFSEEHFLRRYWCCKPVLIDKDRRENGDYFAKPTQYWFVNFEPKKNVIFEPITYNSVGKDAIKHIKKEQWEKMGAKNKTQARSMIHPQYANRFIRQYIIDPQ